jgi:hypothetical protein
MKDRYKENGLTLPSPLETNGNLGNSLPFVLGTNFVVLLVSSNLLYFYKWHFLLWPRTFDRVFAWFSGFSY